MVLNFSPVGDFELVADGLEAHTLRERDGVEYLLTKVLRQEIDRKEVWASNGHYRSGDAVFHLSTTEHATEPSLGAVLVTAAAEEFTVLAVVKDTMGDRWECVGRNLTVSEGLTDRVTIQVAGEPEQDASGHIRPIMWHDEFTEVVARLQVDAGERLVEHGQTVFIQRGTCVFLLTKEVDATRRIKQADGTVWKIVRVGKKDRIDVLFEAEVEQTPWPSL
jgi:hypothetical protein